MATVRIRDIPFIRYLIENRIVQKVWNSWVVRKVRGVSHLSQFGRARFSRPDPRPLNDRTLGGQIPTWYFDQRFDEFLLRKSHAQRGHGRSLVGSNHVDRHRVPSRQPDRVRAPANVPASVSVHSVRSSVYHGPPIYPLSIREYLKPDDMSMLEPLIVRMASNWKVFMTDLFPAEKVHLLDEIRADYPTACVQACREAMRRWLILPGAHTISDIYQTLETCRRPDLVTDLKQQVPYGMWEPEREEPQPADGNKREYSFSSDGSLGIENIDDLMDVLEPAIFQWQPFCMFLPQMSSEKLYEIRGQNPQQSRRCMREALSFWLSGAQRSSRDVINALRANELNSVASRAETLLPMPEYQSGAEREQVPEFGISGTMELNPEHLPFLEPIVSTGAARWNDIMIQLLDDFSWLDEIEYQNPGSLKQAFRDALYKWLKLPGVHTADDILKAMEKCRLSDTVQELRQNVYHTH